MKRDIYVSSHQGSSIRKVEPIAGTSVEQLKGLLSEFTLEAEMEDGGQMVFIRKLDDHMQIVHCRADAEGHVTRIEAFVGAVADGGDAKALNQQLWLEMTKLDYEDSNPEEVAAFLTGPMPSYAVETGIEVGCAAFCLPFFTDGGRKLLAIWASEPAKGASK